MQRTALALGGLLALVLAFAPPVGRAKNVGFPANWTHDHDGEDLSRAVDLTKARLVWGDEFDTLRVDRDGRGDGPWFAPIHTRLGIGKLAVPPDPSMQVANGRLVLSTRQDDAGKWVDVNMQTADRHGHAVTVTNGYVEARIALPVAAGSHAGLWMLTEERGAGHAELDVAEAYGLGDAAVHSSSHVARPERDGHIFASTRSAQRDVFAGFHTYGVLATDADFTVYYDRKVIGRIARQPEQRGPFYLLLSVFEDPGKRQIALEPATMTVDYVRIYASANAASRGG